MRHLSSLFLCFLFAVTLHAQVPQSFTYQGVARDDGSIVTGSIALQLTIHQTTPDGPVVFRERHFPTTNDAGVFSALVGQGTPITGTIAGIDWSAGPYFLQSELDPTGGLTFVDMGTVPLVSVPYALYAGAALNDAVDDADADPSNEIQNLSFDGGTNELSISAGNTITLPSAGAQTISRSGDTLTLSDGGGSVSVQDDDADPANELQTLSQAADVVTLSDGGGSFSIDDADADPSNELQALSKSGNVINLSQGGFVIDDVVDDDANPTNEIQVLNWNPATTTLSLTQANMVDLSSLLGGSAYWELDPLNGIYHPDGDVYIGDPDTVPSLHLARTFLDFHTGTPYFSYFDPVEITFEGPGFRSVHNKNKVEIDGSGLDFTSTITHDSTGFTATTSGFFNGWAKHDAAGLWVQPFAGFGATDYSYHRWNEFYLQEGGKSTSLNIDRLIFEEQGLGTYVNLNGEGAGELNLHNAANFLSAQATGKSGAGIFRAYGLNTESECVCRQSKRVGRSRVCCSS